MSRLKAVVPRRLTEGEIEALLALDVPARLATLDHDGFPRITPIWFIWQDGAFHMTSVEGQPHIRNLRRDGRATVCVDVEEPEVAGGIRPNRQVKGKGVASIEHDRDGDWTRRITRKYVPGPDGVARASARAAVPRLLIRLRPSSLIARGAGPG